MDGRFSAKVGTALLLAVFALAGCEQGTASQGASGASTATTAGSQQTRGMTDAERRLQSTSTAMQRTILEASGSGAALGGGIGLAHGLGPALIGALVGGSAGAGAGGYVGTLQQDYANDEQRLNRMIEDLDIANADAEAVLAAMRAVLEEQRAEIAAIRAAIGTDANAKALLETELASLQRNVDTMQEAIAGADDRLEEAQAARSILDPAQAGTTLDPRLGELSRRIAAMREIATTLAQGA